MKKICILALLPILFSCASNQAYRGEKLLQPMLLPEEGWSVYSNKEGNVGEMVWLKNDGKEQMETVVYLGQKGRDTRQEKELDDKVGSELCKSFESSIISDNSTNGYSSLTWKSSCKLSEEQTIVVLHKAISGDDSFYHLRRIWKSGFSQELVQPWVNYFDKVYICDTRYKDKICPEDVVEAA
jgi:hypothetical protein